MKNNKVFKKLSLSIFSVLLLGMTIVSSTYAFIVINSSVGIDELDINISGTQGLWASLDGINYNQDISKEQITSVITEELNRYVEESEHITYSDMLYSPVTPKASNGLVSFKEITDKLGETAYRLDFTKDSLVRNTTDSNILYDHVNVDTTGQEYIAFDMWFRIVSDNIEADPNKSYSLMFNNSTNIFGDTSSTISLSNETYAYGSDGYLKYFPASNALTSEAQDTNGTFTKWYGNYYFYYNNRRTAVTICPEGAYMNGVLKQITDVEPINQETDDGTIGPLIGYWFSAGVEINTATFNVDLDGNIEIVGGSTGLYLNANAPLVKEESVPTVQHSDFMRLAVLNNNEYQNYLRESASSTTQQFIDNTPGLYVFEPSLGYGSVALEDTYINSRGEEVEISDIFTEEELRYYSKDTNAMLTYYNNTHPMSQITKAATYNESYDTISDLENQVLGQFEYVENSPGGEYSTLKLTIYIYIEGWDADFISGLENAKGSINLAFRLVENN